jgi:hypothetical protein
MKVVSTLALNLPKRSRETTRLPLIPIGIGIPMRFTRYHSSGLALWNFPVAGAGKQFGVSWLA